MTNKRSDNQNLRKKQEDPLSSHSLVPAIVYLFVLFISIYILKLVENE